MTFVQVIAAISPQFGGPSIGALALNFGTQFAGSPTVLITTSMSAPDGSVESVRAAYERAWTPTRHIEIYLPSAPKRLFHSPKLVSRLRSAVRDADGVHIHGLYSVPTIWAYMCCRHYGTPYGMQPHGNLEPFHRTKSRRKKRVFDWLFTRAMIRGAQYVLFASVSERTNAADLVPKSKGRVSHPLGPHWTPPSHPELTPDTGASRVVRQRWSSSWVALLQRSGLST